MARFNKKKDDDIHKKQIKSQKFFAFGEHCTYDSEKIQIIFQNNISGGWDNNEIENKSVGK